MNRLTACTLQQIVYTRNNQKFIAMLFQVDETLVGVNYLLQVDVLLYDMHERILGIIFFVHLYNFIQLYLALHHKCSKNTTSKIATVRNEINL